MRAEGWRAPWIGLQTAVLSNIVSVFCLVYNLTNNIDVENTKVRMEQYQRDNRDVIQRNKAKLVCAAFLLYADYMFMEAVFLC